MNYSDSVFYKVFKRGFDILFSLTVLVLISPIVLTIGLLVKLEDRGPVIFKQERAGKYGRPFKIYKFRSMKVMEKTDENKRNPYTWKNRVPDDFVFKTTEGFNPNVTKIGRFIRRYSLDELPQFLNVLKGEMSIVGPRPEIIEIASCYDKYQSQRLLVKPGITGWAQVNGRSDMNHGKKIKLDLEYVKKRNFFFDIKIILKTVWQAVFGKGAI